MPGAKRGDASVAQYELEIEIDAPPPRVWMSLTEELPMWWLPDFHILGADSVVSFDAQAGGHLIERTPDGSSLLWFTVHWIQPEAFTVGFFGHVGPDWGGPRTSMLKFAVETRGEGSVVKVSDATYGSVDDATLASLKSGWQTLFTDGLKKHVESH